MIVHAFAQPQALGGFGRDADARLLMFRDQAQEIPAGTRVRASGYGVTVGVAEEILTRCGFTESKPTFVYQAVMVTAKQYEVGRLPL